MQQRVIASDLDQARELEASLIQEVDNYGYDQADVFAIKLMLEEALVNAIKHGNKLDPTKTVTVTSDINDDRAEYLIVDQGPGFDPLKLPDPTADENLERPCGRGVMRIRAYMDEVHFNEKGNELRVVKRRGSGEPE